MQTYVNKEKKAEPFYLTPAWQRLRLLIIERSGGWCEQCLRDMKAGKTTKPRRAEMVHHIKPYKDFPELALDESNLEALCNRCHEQKHNRHETIKEAPEAVRVGARIVKV